MKESVFLFGLMLSFFLAEAQKDTLMNFAFEKFNGLLTEEAKSKKNFLVSTARKQIEKVPSLHHSGIRTDGYSVSLTAALPQVLSDNITIASWFALETYPTDTAGFFSLKNTDGMHWVSACVDQFGYPLIGFYSNGTTTYFKGTSIIPKFKWLDVALVIKNSKPELFVDGQKIITAPLQMPDERNVFDSLVIGKDERKKAIGIFPTTYINGIIDEVAVIKGSLNEGDFNTINYENINALTVDLNIPSVRFEKDLNRPKYHLLPAANWTNETHGLIYYKGKYHIFNQKNGNSLTLRRINWGHFSSPDLLNWTEHRPAITPEEGYDELGIWSGHCIIGDNGKPAIIYTGAKNRQFGMCMALPLDDSLLSWQKYAGNPVVKGVPAGYKRTDFRDPYIWKENENYYMAVGFGIDENNSRRGALLLYKSANLKEWNFLHTLFEGDPRNYSSGVFWEMPVVWKENGKYVILVNKVPHSGEPANALYWVGDFINEKFVPDFAMPKKLEVINQLLSPSVAKDKNGLTIAIAIIPDLVTSEAHYEQGWAHLYSIPRVWVVNDGKIKQKPHPALQSLRASHKGFGKKNIPSQKPFLLSTGIRQLEIEIEIDPKNCKRFGFIIGKNPEKEEYTKMYYDFQQQEFAVDKSKSSLNKNIPANGRKGMYHLKKKSKIKIRMFIDGSVVEVFINDQDAFTTRIFPLHNKSNQVELYCEGGDIQLVNANIWKLKESHNRSDF